MKILMRAGVLMLLLIPLSGCHFHVGDSVAGSGIRKIEKRELPSFDSISTEGAFTVEAVTQKPVSFEIEADDNILPLIRSEVRSGVLYLKPEKSFNSQRGVTLRITVPDLSKVEAMGAGRFRVQGLKNDHFEVRTTGAATVTVSGDTKDLEIHTTGAGLVDTHGLRAARANVSSTGAAKVDVYASEQLDANVTGVGQVVYSGDPKVVNKHTAGAATVTKREDTGV